MFCQSTIVLWCCCCCCNDRLQGRQISSWRLYLIVDVAAESLGSGSSFGLRHTTTTLDRSIITRIALEAPHNCDDALPRLRGSLYRPSGGGDDLTLRVFASTNNGRPAELIDLIGWHWQPPTRIDLNQYARARGRSRGLSIIIGARKSS